MTQEQIKRAANSYIDDFLYNHIDYTVIHDNYETGKNNAICEFGPDIFKAGAQWRINSVWHDASERPEVNKRVLVEFFNKYGNYVYYRLKAFKPAQLKYWGIEMAFLDKIIRWTYIEDLLPADSE